MCNTTLTLSHVRTQLRTIGIVIRRTDYGEFRVNYRRGNEPTAYYTNDIEDAFGTGKLMALWEADRCGRIG